MAPLDLLAHLTESSRSFLIERSTNEVRSFKQRLANGDEDDWTNGSDIDEEDEEEKEEVASLC